MNHARTVDVGGEIPYTIAIGPGLLGDGEALFTRKGQHLPIHAAFDVQAARRQDMKLVFAGERGFHPFIGQKPAAVVYAAVQV